MKKTALVIMTALALLAPTASTAALLSSPSRIELSSGGATITRVVDFNSGLSGGVTTLRASLYLSGMSFPSFSGMPTNVDMTPGGFTLTLNNGAPITATSARFAKDTTTGLAINLFFPIPAGSICNTTSVALNLDGSAPQVPISDSTNATLDSFSTALAPMGLFGQPLPACQGLSSSGAPSALPAAPIKYSGPEFSGLSLKPALSGTSTALEGRKLDQISSLTIGGKAAVLSNATDKSVNIGLPAGLAPGVYDLVVTTTNHGKLTHMNAIRIREELVPTSLTIQGTGVLSGNEFKELTAFARTQNPDMNTVTCIVNSGSEGKSFMQARALCDRIAAINLNITTTQFEVRSTVKSSAVFARVVFSHKE